MSELLNYIIQQIVGEDETFKISETESDQGVEYVITLTEAVSGKVIGKGGRTIKAVRDILNIIAREQNKRIYIKVTN